jgi:hypothetical protein
MLDPAQRGISTAALKAADVPSPSSSLDLEVRRGEDAEHPAIWEFAATYRPSASLPDELPRFVAESALSQWERTQELPEIGLDGMRLVLWWLFQHWRHVHTDVPWEQTNPSHAGLARALVEKIHLELYQEESWWWEPDHEPTDEERWQRALARSNEGRDVAELYDLAAELLSEMIDRRDAGEDDPLNLPLIEADRLRAFRLHAAWHVARGLLAIRDGDVEAARDLAYEGSVEVGP